MTTMRSIKETHQEPQDTHTVIKGDHHHIEMLHDKGPVVQVMLTARPQHECATKYENQDGKLHVKRTTTMPTWRVHIQIETILILTNIRFRLWASGSLAVSEQETSSVWGVWIVFEG
jgi:4-hydroxy-3-methylbut-2-enyl diphosphate reductase IspH